MASSEDHALKRMFKDVLKARAVLLSVLIGVPLTHKDLSIIQAGKHTKPEGLADSPVGDVDVLSKRAVPRTMPKLAHLLSAAKANAASSSEPARDSVPTPAVPTPTVDGLSPSVAAVAWRIAAYENTKLEDLVEITLKSVRERVLERAKADAIDSCARAVSAAVADASDELRAVELKSLEQKAVCEREVEEARQALAEANAVHAQTLAELAAGTASVPPVAEVPLPVLSGWIAADDPALHDAARDVARAMAEAVEVARAEECARGAERERGMRAALEHAHSELEELRRAITAAGQTEGQAVEQAQALEAHVRDLEVRAVEAGEEMRVAQDGAARDKVTLAEAEAEVAKLTERLAAADIEMGTLARRLGEAASEVSFLSERLIEAEASAARESERADAALRQASISAAELEAARSAPPGPAPTVEPYHVEGGGELYPFLLSGHSVMPALAGMQDKLASALQGKVLAMEKARAAQAELVLAHTRLAGAEAAAGSVAADNVTLRRLLQQAEHEKEAFLVAGAPVRLGQPQAGQSHSAPGRGPALPLTRPITAYTPLRPSSASNGLHMDSAAAAVGGDGRAREARLAGAALRHEERKRLLADTAKAMKRGDALASALQEARGTVTELRASLSRLGEDKGRLESSLGAADERYIVMRKELTAARRRTMKLLDAQAVADESALKSSLQKKRGRVARDEEADMDGGALVSRSRPSTAPPGSLPVGLGGSIAGSMSRPGSPSVPPLAQSPPMSKAEAKEAEAKKRAEKAALLAFLAGDDE